LEFGSSCGDGVRRREQAVTAGTKVEECVMGWTSPKRVRQLGLVASVWSALACGGNDAVLRSGDAGASDDDRLRGSTGGQAADSGAAGADAVGATHPTSLAPADASDSGDTANTSCAGPLTFADPDVETVVRLGIGLPNGPIHEADVVGLTDLNFETVFAVGGNVLCPPDGGQENGGCTEYPSTPQADGYITSLLGVECLPNVRSVEVDPFFLDLTPLAALPNLATISFGPTEESSFPQLPQVTALYAYIEGTTAAILLAMPSLRSLELAGAVDLSSSSASWALWALTGLRRLSVPRSGLVNTVPLSHLTNLTDVDLSGNQIQDISELAMLPALRSLDLSNNQITDLAPLVANPGLGFGSAIDVTGNALDCTSQNIATLRARGVTVLTDCP
jgi:internalin A